MKRFLIILPVLLMMLAGLQSALALTPYGEKAKAVKWKLEYIKRPYAERKDDSLTLSFSSVLTGKLSNSNSVYYVPIYQYGKDSLLFPEAGLYTRMEARFWQRRNVFSGKRQDREIHIRHRNDTAIIKYSKSVFMPKDRESGKLIMRIYGHDCCNEELLAIDTILVSERKGLSEGNRTIATKVNKKRVQTNRRLNMSFFYLVGEDELFPVSTENEEMLLALKKEIEPLLADTGLYRIKQIEIRGYASPEAAYNYNLSLTERRAALFKRYLLRTYPLANCKIKTEGCGEDWDGLYRMLIEKGKNSPSVSQVLNIIDKYGIFEGRERLLMELDRGVPYDKLRKEFFPLLRRVELVIDYEIRYSNG